MSRTIAAISTGIGPVGIIRISGDDMFHLIKKIFVPKFVSFDDMEPRKLYVGNILSRSNAVIDSGLVTFMNSPKSYTGEDMAEIQCHGSNAILLEILSHLFKLGAIAAGPGEFTKRAFLNGKLDLSGAEAVGDLVSSKTIYAAQNASSQVLGTMFNKIRDMRDKLIDMVAHFHAVVDYPDEDIDAFLFDSAKGLLHDAAAQLYSLAESFERGKLLKEGIPCAIIGKPNVGKSSLLNVFCGNARAIVTDIPGTTRDLIEESVGVGPVVLRFCDTAGLHETTDPVEKIGVERALSQASKSSFILSVFDCNSDISDDDLMCIAKSQGKTAIAIINKCDLEPKLDIAKLKRHFDHIVHVSAKNGQGIDELLELIVRLAGFTEESYDGNIITNARQAAALARAAQRCEEAFFAAQSGMTPDAVVMDAEGAICALGEITGQSVTDDIVQRIFENFCVGK